MAVGKRRKKRCIEGGKDHVTTARNTGLEASSSHEELLRAHYRVLRTIGEGGFASVQLAKHLPTDSLVTVKTINKRDCPSVYTELDILKSVEHPNIIKLYKVVEAEQQLNLVMEYLEGGDLADYVYKVGRLREQEARLLFRQIMRAVRYCHDHGIIHWDLKAENILQPGHSQAMQLWSQYAVPAPAGAGQVVRDNGLLAP
ncbi:PREDICTED: serine/threonine-protein kinase MARK2-like [Dipodomys ordii]|uniref:non-specific serine/threonine protein kinase n=1 Tax=Dipodomys ordii TaxID=10020 RepID=A0A1S3FUB3_DIPOR|nr:PREDICTED: serine/threonine-protein kinase MARK2-like [Dipodomys ordii]